nr:immunoglobulin heavy chain junction region [Macaca mulatta]MOW24374.1 immunoglobulin heavy chain junction region [Macaca mulatta]MOW24385.1 immunoglobulin heavy chain junction region [Macaca mulatta]MOW24739.1 immunoglobulin heavy chain junction region [Macaca mulatta]MOW24949.1 immunoglobulin heavy chain junction region [Macaca mulatta]
CARASQLELSPNYW